LEAARRKTRCRVWFTTMTTNNTRKKHKGQLTETLFRIESGNQTLARKWWYIQYCIMYKRLTAFNGQVCVLNILSHPTERSMMIDSFHSTFGKKTKSVLRHSFLRHNIRTSAGTRYTVSWLQ
jgi:hypothetical protein